MLALEDVAIVQTGFRLEADLAIRPGARVAVLGPSGSGKSTLLGAIAGFVPISAGRVCWKGRDLARLAPGARPLSILFQDNNLFPHLTAVQNVSLALDPGLRLSREDRAGVASALDSVGLGGLGSRRPAQLSGGQQSRLALARVLLRARPLLLLDEPFAALGPALKAEMLALVTRIAAETGATVLMVTHDPRDAQSFADEVVLVDEGRAEPPMPTVEMFESPPPKLRAYLGSSSRT